MNKGKIVACGDPGSVQKGSLFSDVFAVDLAVGANLVFEGPLVMPSRWLVDG